MTLNTTASSSLPVGITAKNTPVKHPNTVDSFALIPRKTVDPEADTFERNSTLSAVKPAGTKPKPAGTDWVLPVLGSLSGIGLAIGTYFLGRNQGAEEANKVFQKATGLAGKTEEALKASLQTKLDEAVANIPKGAVVISTQLREHLITLTKQQADVTDEALLQALQAHSAATATELQARAVLLQDQKSQLADALVAVGVPFTDVEGRDKPFEELVTLAQGKITQTSEENAGLQEAIQTAYAKLHPDGKETEVTQQLEALQQVGQTIAEQEVQHKQTLKNALIQFGVDADAVEYASTKVLEDELNVKITNQLEALKTAQQDADQADTASAQVKTVLATVQEQFRKTQAATINNIGTELAEKYVDVSPQAQKYKLRELIEGRLPEGLQMVDVSKVLKQGFDSNTFGIEGTSGVYGKEVGFGGENATKLSNVGQILSGIIGNFDTVSQLSQDERTLITNWLEALLKHPDVAQDAKTLKHYRNNALLLDEHFAVNAQLLNTVSDIVVKVQKLKLDDNSLVELCNALLTHPLMGGLPKDANSPVRKALEGVMPTLIQELKDKPQTFHADSKLNSVEVILSRAIELATEESLLENLANYPLFTKNSAEGSRNLIPYLTNHVLNPNTVLQELTELPARKLTDGRNSNLYRYGTDDLVQGDCHRFSYNLITAFAEQFFPEVIEAFNSKKVGGGTVFFGSEATSILEALNERAVSLNDRNAREAKLKRAIDALNDIHRNFEAMLVESEFNVNPIILLSDPTESNQTRFQRIVANSPVIKQLSESTIDITQPPFPGQKLLMPVNEERVIPALPLVEAEPSVAPHLELSSVSTVDGDIPEGMARLPDGTLTPKTLPAPPPKETKNPTSSNAANRLLNRHNNSK